MPADEKKAVQKIRSSRQQEPDVNALSEQVRKGDVVALSRAITLVESTKHDDRKLAESLVKILLPFSGNSIRVGITGVPGAGKSTFIEALGSHLTSLGKKVAVLAVDPSSQAGKGSILGDKTRMTELSSNPNAFVRPSPSSGTLGGVAGKTREAIFLCEAAGFDYVFIETVGVGQSETEVHSMTDFFILITISGAGDELQGIKRGIMEMADLVLVNKADGDNLARAKSARQDIARALHFFPPLTSGWTANAAICSSTEKSGIKEVAETLQKYLEHSKSNGYFDSNRKQQLSQWLRESISRELSKLFFENSSVSKLLSGLEKQVQQNQLTTGEALEKLMQVFRNPGK